MGQRIVVVGVGGVGGFFGGLLARHGEDVTFIARGETLEALRARGLAVRSPQVGDFTVTPAATDDRGSLEPPDLVLFCVKTYDLDRAAEQIRPLVGPGTVVLPLQNGVDATERLGRIVGEDAVLVGVTYVRAGRSAPTVIDHVFSTQVIVGEPRGGLSARVAGLADLLRGADIAAEAQADSLVPLWVKFVGVCGAALTALTRLPLGPILACSETRAMLQDTLREVAAVGQARGVSISEDVVDRLMGVFAGYLPSARSSLAEDLEAGRRLELESLQGTVVRLGHELDVPTPLNRAIYAALKPYVDGSPPMP